MKKMHLLTRKMPWAGLLAMTLLLVPAHAEDEQSADSQDETPAAAMTNERIETLIKRLDPEAKGGAGQWQLRIEGVDLLVITDSGADRMRVMAPVGEMEQDTADNELLYRLMQANFDTALDARYAIARGVLWSVFMHPLSPLDDRGFLSGVGQTVTLAATFGSSYSSGAMHYRGGDSAEKLEELHDRIVEKGERI